MDPDRLDRLLTRLRWSLLIALLLAGAITWVALGMGSIALPPPESVDAMRRGGTGL